LKLFDSFGKEFSSADQHIVTADHEGKICLDENEMRNLIAICKAKPQRAFVLDEFDKFKICVSSDDFQDEIVIQSGIGTV